MTDIAKYRNEDDPRFVIQNWMRNRNTIEFLGVWEELHNPSFNRVQFEAVRKEVKMEYKILEQFYKFQYGWQRNLNIDFEAKQFLNVIDSAKKENDVQKYIKENKKWFIPASIFKDYDFGHHEAYMSVEQALGAEYKADYMLLGRNSIGYHIVLVEFEDVNIDYKIHTANIEAESIRKGLAQIKDWKRWIDYNKEYFLNSCGLSNIAHNIPTWGFCYCLVVGRRNRMDSVSNQLRRQMQHEISGLHIISYDRLVDNIGMLGNGF